MDLSVVPPEFREHVSDDGTRATLDNVGLDAVPEWLSALTSLTELDLGRNRLTELPGWLADLTGLTELDLSDNQLTSLPGWLGSLTGLVRVDLSGNQLTTLPEQVAALRADGTELVLDGNPL